MLQESSPKTHYRKDIQALRAIAVIAVIIFHLEERWLQSGFLGVDVFFVISGYVVTISLHQKVLNFSFNEVLLFYIRRIKRLFPALYFAIFTGSLLAFLVIPAFEHSHIFKTAFYAILAWSNNYLAFNAFDYFGVQAEFNPFIHTWSLGVEEQFYMIYPFVFYLVFILLKKWQLPLLLLFYIVSFALFFYLTFYKSQQWYYLSLSRFWELVLGLLAYHVDKKQVFNLKSFKPGIWLVIGLTLTFLIPNDSRFNLFVSTILATHITFFLIISLPNDYSRLKEIFSYPVIQLIGNMSYSLYLWHFIIFVLFRWTVGMEGVLLKFIAVSLTFLIAYFSLVVLENPFRKMKKRLGLVLLPLIFCGFVLGFMLSQNHKIVKYWNIDIYKQLPLQMFPHQNPGDRW